MRFLRTVFAVGETHHMFQADVLRWKCFAPHPFWEGSRGYALRYKGEIAAFGCVAPCRFAGAAGSVASCNVIDWAASKAVPGAGILLYKHIQTLAGTMINIGGTDDARQVLPRIGFQIRAELHHYTRVVRPWRHFSTAPQKDWKSPLRLARDYRELSRGSGSKQRLTTRRIHRFDHLAASLRESGTPERTPELLNYFLECPAAKIEAHLLERDGATVGYFLLSRAGNECRIAEVRVSTADYRADAYAAAIAAARLDANTTHITTAATSALEWAGFRRTHSEPVFVLDPEHRLSDPPTVSLLENDGYYWNA